VAWAAWVSKQHYKTKPNQQYIQIGEHIMSVKPLEDRILIQQLDREEKTESGIYLPESAAEKPMQGKVIATGPGKLLDNGERATPAVKEGDVVVFGKYSGTEIEIKGVAHLIVRESELLGMIEG
jgi:chaperonin GroES